MKERGDKSVKESVTVGKREVRKYDDEEAGMTASR
jgi:hypothetical protein